MVIPNTAIKTPHNMLTPVTDDIRVPLCCHVGSNIPSLSHELDELVWAAGLYSANKASISGDYRMVVTAHDITKKGFI
jgi:hypothetical protein